MILGLQLDQLVDRGGPPLGATAVVGRAREPDNRLTAGASGTIAGLRSASVIALSPSGSRGIPTPNRDVTKLGQSIKPARRSTPHRLRNECLNEHLFSSLAAARRIIESWRVDYNTERSHTSLDGLTPAAFAARPTQEHT